MGETEEVEWIGEQNYEKGEDKLKNDDSRVENENDGNNMIFYFISLYCSLFKKF